MTPPVITQPALSLKSVAPDAPGIAPIASVELGPPPGTMRYMADTIRCSFCGRSNLEAGNMLEKSDQQVPNRWVRICLECAVLAVDSISAAADREKPNNRGVQ